MSMFLCLVQHDGHTIPADIRRQYSSRRAAQTIAPSRWHCGPGIASLVGSDVVGLRPAVATDGPLTGVGLVQLENRREVARWAGLANTQAHDVMTDLAVVVKAARRSSCEWVLARLCGDFALVIWNAETRDATAVRDAFGVRCLFIKPLGAITAFASRASLLATYDNYDLEYIAEYLVNGYDASSHSAFADVAALEAGEISIVRKGRETRRQYWPSVHISPSAPGTWESAVDNFRDLLVTSVLTRLRSSHPSWAQLSGGMDSSSIVAIAQTLAESGRVRDGLAGAVTYETVPAVGGDPAFARMVAERHQLELQTVRDWWLWKADESGPPRLDQPGATLASYVIDRQTTRIVRRAGGKVLLAGVGADVYLRPGLDFIATLMADHHFGSAVRELAGWASELRASAWTLGYIHGLYPLLPASARMMLARPDYRVPGWITPAFRQRFALRERSPAIRSYAGGVRQQQRSRTLHRLHAEGALLPRERLGEENLDWSYPFLSRPLVEFTLELPRNWLMEPGMSKRILREAMRGILPDAVRLRRGKGGIHPQPTKALSLEHDRISALTERPVLEELGCVDSRKLREAIHRSERGQLDGGGAILNTLSLEMWLRSRSDRWPRVQLRSQFGDHSTINGRIPSVGG